MKQSAFTLVEVLVSMAIVGILAGMMVPAIYKWWENQEISTTRQRMKEVRNALVGDRTLMQNGARTHFGFVGDNGELAFGNTTSIGGLSYLASKPPSGVYPYWNGPYMAPGFDPTVFAQDAWGRNFRYTLTASEKDGYGRYVRAELRSAGPNGIFGDSDDIVDADLQISDRDVTPTNRIQGNFQITVANNDSSATPPPFRNFSCSLKLSLEFRDPIDSSGKSVKDTGCKYLGWIETVPLKGAISKTFGNFSTLMISGANSLKLPIGRLRLQGKPFLSPNCAPGTDNANLFEFTYFVGDNIQSINIINLPMSLTYQ